MFGNGPDARELAAIGLRPEDYPEQIADVWPDNWRAVELMDELSGQWRSGPAGPYALDYAVLYHRLDRMHLDRETYEQLYADVRVLEAEGLKAMRET